MREGEIPIEPIVRETEVWSDEKRRSISEQEKKFFEKFEGVGPKPRKKISLEPLPRPEKSPSERKRDEDEMINKTRLNYLKAEQDLTGELKDYTTEEKIEELKKKYIGIIGLPREDRKNLTLDEQISLETNKDTIEKLFQQTLKSDPALCSEVFFKAIRKYIDSELKAGRSLKDIDDYFMGRSISNGNEEDELILIQHAFIKTFGYGDPAIKAIEKVLEQYKSELKVNYKEETIDNQGLKEEKMEGDLVKESLGSLADDIKAREPDYLEGISIKRDNSDESEVHLEDYVLKKYLSYQDTEMPDEQKESMLEYNRNSPSANKYANSILKLADKYNLSIIEKKAEEMINECESILKKLEINPSPFAASKTWGVWDMAKQYYYFNNPAEADKKYLIADPLDSKVKFQEIINRHLGWEAYKAFREGNSQFLEPVKDLELRQQIAEYLRTSPKENGTLESDKLAKLGELIRRASEERR